MEFPLLNITDHYWDPLKVELQLIFDEYFYLGKEAFSEFYRDKFF